MPDPLPTKTPHAHVRSKTDHLSKPDFHHPLQSLNHYQFPTSTTSRPFLPLTTSLGRRTSHSPQPFTFKVQNRPIRGRDERIKQISNDDSITDTNDPNYSYSITSDANHHIIADNDPHPWIYHPTKDIMSCIAEEGRHTVIRSSLYENVGGNNRSRQDNDYSIASYPRGGGGGGQLRIRKATGLSCSPVKPWHHRNM